MTNDEPRYAEPAQLRFLEEGGMSGGNARYEKHLKDVVGVYRDDADYRRALAADNGEPHYWVQTSSIESGEGALTIGISTIRPGRIGDEFFMTRGHIHAKEQHAELYYGLAGRGVMLMDTLDGQSRAIEITPGVAVHVPGHWIHRSVNVGDVPFSTLFCYGTDAGQDYGVIADAGGMANLVVPGANGWNLRPNPDHQAYRAPVEVAS